MIHRVDVTEAAAGVIERLKARYGEILFHQSGGCCDGSVPMCYPAHEFSVGRGDVYLGDIAGCRFYMNAAQYDYWQHTHLTIDVMASLSAGFSLEAAEGMRFTTQSRLFSDEEAEELKRLGPPLRAQ